MRNHHVPRGGCAGGGIAVTGGPSEQPPWRQRWEFPAARILIVDDSIDNRDLARLVLEEVGLRVHEAQDGRTGVDKALAERYELILMDVQMPEMDGFAATRALRDAGLETPVIALTANAEEGFEDRCLAAGYTAHLAKPIDIDELLHTLASYVGGRRASTPVEAVGHARGAVPAAAAEPIASALVSNRPALRVVAEQFLERLEDRLGAMELALTRGDFDELARLAHWLEGTGGTVGFAALDEPARALELRAKACDGAAAREVLAELREMQGRLAPDAPAATGPRSTD